MGEILVSILFIYPGALIEMIYQRWAKYGYKDRQVSDQTKVGEYFLYSATVFIISIWLYQVLIGVHLETAADVFERFSDLGEALVYFVFSIIVTLAVAGLRYLITGMSPRRRNTSEKVNGCDVVGSVNTWRELMYGPSLESILKHCIVRINANGCEIAGFVTCFPENFEDGISLTQSDFVMRVLKEEEKPNIEKYIGAPHAVYVDTASGIIVEFFDGTKLKEYLEK